MDMAALTSGLVGGAILGIGAGYFLHLGDGATSTLIIVFSLIGALAMAGMLEPILFAMCDLLDAVTGG